MSDRSQQIETLKKIFNEAKYARRSGSGRFDNLAFHEKFEDALIDVGKEYFPELKDEVYSYLKDIFPEFRAEAVRTLGWNTRLFLKEFCLDDAPKIWLNDPDEEVKSAALVAWSGYYSRKKDPKMLKILYKIICSHQYSILIRSWALTQFFNVSDGWINKLEEYNEIIEMDEEVADHNEFDIIVDWDRVHQIMKECVSGWTLANTKT